MPKIIVTGINGFVGNHLARELKGRGVDVVGVSREPILHASLLPYVGDYYACDLVNPKDVARLPLEDIDSVINLAGFAAVGTSYGQEELYMRVNVGILTVIGERIIELGLKTRMLAISTGAVYSPNQSLPLHENSELISAGSPYALSKIAMEKEAGRLRALGLNCILARPFNHIGPGQEQGFLVPDLYQKIVAAMSSGGVIKVGDLSTKRDYTDVRDVARAYANLVLSKNLNQDTYNICSGHSIAGSIILNILTGAIKGAGAIKTVLDKSLVRPNDPQDLFGDNWYLRAETGWSPSILTEQTILDFVASKQS